MKIKKMNIYKNIFYNKLKKKIQSKICYIIKKWINFECQWINSLNIYKTIKI